MVVRRYLHRTTGRPMIKEFSFMCNFGNGFPTTSLRTSFVSPPNENRGVKNAVSGFNRLLLARILIYWVGSFNGWNEVIGLTRMVMNGNR